MSQAQSWQQFVSSAELRRKSYDWLEAAKSYRTALGLVSEHENETRAILYEEFGYALFQASIQADSEAEFRVRIDEAISAYEKAVVLYGKLGENAKQLRCRALLAWAGFWKVSEASEKKRLAEESWKFTTESMSDFVAIGDGQESWKTWDRLAPTSNFCWWYQWDHSVSDGITRDGLKLSERALQYLSTTNDPTGLARAYVIAAGFVDVYSTIVSDPAEQEKSRLEARVFWDKASKLSEEAAHLEFLLCGPSLAFFGTGSDESLSFSLKLLDYSKISGDRWRTGFALESLAFHSLWKARGSEDPDVNAALVEQSLQYAMQAKKQYSPILYKSSLSAVMWSEEPYPYFFFESARLEPDSTRRRSLLKKGLEASSQLLKAAGDSLVPYNISSANHVTSKILEGLARLETTPDKKRKLLETALHHRKETITIIERIAPNYYWDIGVFQNYLSNINYELSRVEPTTDDKRRALEEALAAKESSLDYWARAMPMIEKSPSSIETLGERYVEYGDLLTSLFSLTSANERLERAVEAFEKGLGLLYRSGTVSRAAEAYWKLAQTYDILGNHVKGAKAFDQASESFHLAAEKIPQLKDLYTRQAAYMEAWSNIETAKQHHARQEYELAGRSYEKAATLHRSTKQWNFLAPNYSAWAEVETAEDLSRKDLGEQAIQAFQRAIKLFREGRNTLSLQPEQIETGDQTRMVSRLIKVAGSREEYCSARIILEEAKTLDREGDHYSSSEKYGHAVDAFEKIVQSLDRDPSITEFRLIVALSKAWQKMTGAEAEASPGLYLEASKLFEDAKEFSPTEKSKMLALGHSRFCKALEAGARFTDTRDRSFYEKAIQSLESAVSFYVKAGFELGSDYVKACKLLFDGYVYVDDANSEKDHEKKTRLYAMAEKVLQASADSYGKAHYLGRQEEVLALLKKVREDREIARSLSDILYGPSITSTTASFNMPTPTSESAVGLERFEHAAVEANLIVHHRELRVGEDFDLEIELVNAGRGTAQLVKMEHIVPAGFNITGQPEHYRLEDSFLNMKGKQLSPLKTEEVKLVVKPQTRGRFTLKPRILYLDDTGVYKTHEPAPVELTVKELGISGWVRGRS